MFVLKSAYKRLGKITLPLRTAIPLSYLPKIDLETLVFDNIIAIAVVIPCKISLNEKRKTSHSLKHTWNRTGLVISQNTLLEPNHYSYKFILRSSNKFKSEAFFHFLTGIRLWNNRTTDRKIENKERVEVKQIHQMWCRASGSGPTLGHPKPNRIRSEVTRVPCTVNWAPPWVQGSLPSWWWRNIWSRDRSLLPLRLLGFFFVFVLGEGGSTEARPRESERGSWNWSGLETTRWACSFYRTELESSQNGYCEPGWTRVRWIF